MTFMAAGVRFSSDLRQILCGTKFLKTVILPSVGLIIHAAVSFQITVLKMEALSDRCVHGGLIHWV